MTIEIHSPSLVQRLTTRIATGQFHDADELIEKALDALDEHAVASPGTETGAVVLAALQAVPDRGRCSSRASRDQPTSLFPFSEMSWRKTASCAGSWQRRAYAKTGVLQGSWVWRP